MINDTKVRLLESRISSMEIVIDMLNEMTKEEMLKAGYSKTKQKAMIGWIQITKNMLNGLIQGYEKELDEIQCTF